MAKILVTGATGFLGSEIVRQAVAAGHDVVALRRKTSSIKRLEGIKLTWATGDVNDLPSLEAAMQGVEYVIHTAGDTSYYIRDRERQEKINIEGVKNVVTAAKKMKIKRLIHTSSVAAIGFDPAGGTVDETIQWNWPTGLPYMETKRDGEAVAMKAAREGLEVIILNPATIMGPGGMNASEEQLIREVRTQKVPAVPPGGMTVCDVTDVAAAHLAALDKGVSGNRYILGGHNVTHRELMEAFGKAFQVPVPKGTAPGWLLGVAGGVLLQCERIGIKMETPAAMVRLARFGIYHSSQKAIKELGYKSRPLSETVSRVVADFRARDAKV